MARFVLDQQIALLEQFEAFLCDLKLATGSLDVIMTQWHGGVYDRL